MNWSDLLLTSKNNFAEMAAYASFALLCTVILLRLGSKILHIQTHLNMDMIHERFRVSAIDFMFVAQSCENYKIDLWRNVCIQIFSFSACYTDNYIKLVNTYSVKKPGKAFHLRIHNNFFFSDFSLRLSKHITNFR